MLIEVQTMRQNTGNWEYNIKADKELINTDHVVRIRPSTEKGVFFVHLVGMEERYPVIIDKPSFDKIAKGLQIKS
jgi:hypothetical protein